MGALPIGETTAVALMLAAVLAGVLGIQAWALARVLRRHKRPATVRGNMVAIALLAVAFGLIRGLGRWTLLGILLAVDVPVAWVALHARDRWGTPFLSLILGLLLAGFMFLLGGL